MSWRINFALVFLLALSATAANAATCYVKADAAGTNSGASWANAFTNPQSAFANLGCTTVFIARGTYKPTQTTDRTISFSVKPGVVVYGGFAGTEALISDRFLPANPTVLSGDIGVAGDSSDNSYHVVVFDGTTASGTITTGNLLSDVTIRDGNANGAGANDGYGGGLYCNGQGAGHECSPELANLIFENNSAQAGAAICNDGHAGGKSSPWLHDAIIRNNEAPGGAGGGLYNNGGSGTSSPLIEQVTFSGNSADLGGAIYNYGIAGVSSPTIRNSTFESNVAASNGGAVMNYGASGGHASPILRYTTFHHNRAVAGHGGAIYNFAPSADAAPNMSGMIFWADQALGSPVENYTAFSATVSSIEYSITPECPPGAVSCINADPLLGALQDNGGFAPTLRPDVGSPAIDAGNAVNCPGLDERLIARPQAAQCDLGAVELKASEKKRCYVNYFALPPTDGTSWATAYPYVQQALADASCTEVWVAKATYRPDLDTNDRSSFLPVYPGKNVYGGFVVGATARSQRDPANNETILSGDIGAGGDSSDDSYHVVVLDAVANGNITAATIVDGFTIQSGNANGAVTAAYGGGMICNGNTNHVCSPTLTNLVFKNNQATYGGGLALIGQNGLSSPVLRAVDFVGNSASQRGGGVFATGVDGVSNASYSAATFDGNHAKFGGAVYTLAAGASFAESTFSANSADNVGGAVHNGDALGGRILKFESVTFAGNSAISSGAVTLGSQSTSQFDHVVFSDNVLTGQSDSGAISVGGGSVTITDALFLRNGGPAYFGGAIASYSASLAIDRAAFVDNNARYGGAIYIVAGDGNASSSITNTTFSGNAAVLNGGAVIGDASAGRVNDVLLKNVTFAGNSATNGGALSAGQNGTAGVVTLTVGDAILWGDSASSSAEIFTGTGMTTAIDHSLITNGCPAGSTCSSVSAADPLLGMLQYYGGFSPALMPAANSPALNVGVNCTQTDQRGVARPQGAACDIGAVERRTTEDYLFNNGFDW